MLNSTQNVLIYPAALEVDAAQRIQPVTVLLRQLHTRALPRLDGPPSSPDPGWLSGVLRGGVTTATVKLTSERRGPTRAPAFRKPFRTQKCGVSAFFIAFQRLEVRLKSLNLEASV